MTTGVGEAPRSVQRRGWQSLLAALAVILIVDLLVRGLIDGIVAQNAQDWPYNPAISRLGGMVVSRFVEVAAVLGALALLFRLTHYGAFGDLGLRARGSKWLPVGLVMPLLGLVVGALILFLAGVLPVERLLYPGPWPTGLTLAAATQAAWIEELVFRGAIMQGVERLAGGGTRARIAAIAVSAALYASLHFFAPFTLTWAWWVAVIVGGLGFGYAFYATGRSLWTTIGLHWGFDLGVFLLLGVPGESRGWINARLLGVAPSLSPTGGYVMVLGALLTACAIVVLLQKGRQEHLRRQVAPGEMA